MLSIAVHGSPQPPDITLDPDTIGFGRIFSPHMFLMEYDPEQGWHSPRIERLDDFRLHPATMSLHYGQTIFEGQKAFRHPDGSVFTFRPTDHIARLNRSARRMVIPELPEDLVLEAISALVGLDRDWTPPEPGALYLRPAVIATDPFLGVRASDTYLFFIILSPVGRYIQGAMKGIRACTSANFSRACPGGTGEAKTGGNYAGSLLAARQARSEGFQQVIWVDAKERRYIEEMGAMNLLYVDQGTLVTSPLTGTVLPGITRLSLQALAPELGVPFEERLTDISDLCAWIDSGRVSEVLGSGTAAVVTPVGAVSHAGQEHRVGDGQPGPVALKLYDHLTGLQYGRRPDPHGWLHRLC